MHSKTNLHDRCMSLKRQTIPSLLVTSHLGSVYQNNNGSLALLAAALVLQVRFDDHSCGAAVLARCGRPELLALPQDKIEDLADGNWLQHRHTWVSVFNVVVPIHLNAKGCSHDEAHLQLSLLGGC